MSNSNDTEQEAGMTDPNRLSNGMLVTGDSTVDWTIAEPKGRSGSAIESRYAWTMFDGPGVSSIAGGAALDFAILQAASQVSGENVSISGPVIPREILGDPQSAQITRSFSSWAPLLKTTDGKELAWRMERFIGLHPAGGYSMNTASSHIEFEPACI